ncbi:hypothetical protein KFE25_001743 [Diacronema lutheri]|uniref:Uncharacterized protein n=1 Tax=Diacronema lutheri TaxID=2081491 RepID=A0A8J5XPB5_DIALT|nr:hypothetical protein KFE25_001743 [Diacronema lutheri]
MTPLSSSARLDAALRELEGAAVGQRTAEETAQIERTAGQLAYVYVQSALTDRLARPLHDEIGLLAARLRTTWLYRTMVTAAVLLLCMMPHGGG